eukprot:s2820_g9.t1
MAKKPVQKNNRAASAKRTVKTRRGPADVLEGPAFKAWLSHLATTGPTWVWVVTSLCHLFCGRVSEILHLKRSDIDLAGGWVRIVGLKKHGEIYKPLSSAARQLLEGWERDGGKVFGRTKKWGNLGLRSFQDRWAWPVEADGWLFPAGRSDAKQPNRNKADLGF